MKAEQVLNDDAMHRLKEVGRADIVVGIPSYRNASTIAHVVQVAAEGMRHYFPDMKAVLINADSNSPDGTMNVVRQTPVPPGVEKIITPYKGLSGKGSAFQTIFALTKALQARACVVVDSDLRSITPEWIHKLAGPIAGQSYSYIAPMYIRHKHDGTITNNITYPLTRMLYGADVRQPIGGDFGFSSELAGWWLEQDIWQSDVARFGIDIWMTTTAIAEGFNVGQAGLGLKIHDAKDPAQSLGPMFSQVVGTLFGLMERYETVWQAVNEIRPVPLIGEPPQGEPERVPVTLSLLVEKLQTGLIEHQAALDRVLPTDLRRDLHAIARERGDHFVFPAEVWVPVVFYFAAAYHRRKVPADHLMAALVPLYYGRTAGMVNEAAGMDSETFEWKVVQKQADVFWQMKPDLVAMW